MSFEHGHKKIGGRKKGSIAKNRKELIEKAEALGIDVFETLLLFAAGDWKRLGYDSPHHVTGKTLKGEEIVVERISPELRQKSANDAAKYISPQLKAVDVSTSEGKEAITVNLNLSSQNETSNTEPHGADKTPA